MGAPTVQPFRPEDVPSTGLGTREAVESFYRQLNMQLQGLAAPLSSGLTFSNNMNAQVKNVIIKVPATDWVTVLDAGMSNSWVTNAGLTVKYRQEGMLTGRLIGNVKSGTVGSKAFTLPASLCPGQTAYLPAGSNSAFGQLSIATTGDVVPAVGSNLSFSLESSWALATPSAPVLSCFPITVQTTVNQPSMVVLGALQDQTTRTAVSAPGSIHWKSMGAVSTQASAQAQSAATAQYSIQILNLPGLILGHTYQATLLILGG